MQQNNNGLWEKIANRNQNNKLNRSNSDSSNALYNSIIFGAGNGSGGGFLGSGSSSGDSSMNLQKGIKGLTDLASTFKGSGSSGANSSIASAVGNEVNGFGGGSGSAITNAINGSGGSGSALQDAIGSEVGSGASSGGSWGSNVPWAAIAIGAKKGYNKISNKTDKDYSDTEEAIIYPLQGAAMGASYGKGNPWATAGGALYGLGYAFKDDLGMKDSNFLTQMLFPIGMGDGGGLKIGGESILDLG